MQPPGRSVPSSARALIADGGQRNESLCGHELECPQLMRMSSGRRPKRRRVSLRCAGSDSTIGLARSESNPRP